MGDADGLAGQQSFGHEQNHPSRDRLDLPYRHRWIRFFAHQNQEDRRKEKISRECESEAAYPLVGFMPSFYETCLNKHGYTTQK
jgi:hypothetical protein